MNKIKMIMAFIASIAGIGTAFTTKASKKSGPYFWYLVNAAHTKITRLLSVNKISTTAATQATGCDNIPIVTCAVAYSTMQGSLPRVIPISGLQAKIYMSN